MPQNGSQSENIEIMGSHHFAFVEFTDLIAKHIFRAIQADWPIGRIAPATVKIKPTLVPKMERFFVFIARFQQWNRPEAIEANLPCCQIVAQLYFVM